jgi:hypothetical protein
MNAIKKAWRVTLILELDRCLSPEEFRELSANAAGQAILGRGSRRSELAPELSVTTVAETTQSQQAVETALREIEERLDALPCDRHIVRLRNYLVAA